MNYGTMEQYAGNYYASGLQSSMWHNLAQVRSPQLKSSIIIQVLQQLLLSLQSTPAFATMAYPNAGSVYVNAAQ